MSDQGFVKVTSKIRQLSLFNARTPITHLNLQHWSFKIKRKEQVMQFVSKTGANNSAFSWEIRGKNQCQNPISRKNTLKNSAYLSLHW